ncbi:MAG: hypothetical protein H6809_03020 [Phycisphaeraceae bacterium]|nr:hypothetical protein [Phycisphaeraceae bacterium]
MLTATIGAVALVALAHPDAGRANFLGRQLNDGRLLATPSPIPANGVYSVRGDGSNNRLWISRGVTRDFEPALDWGRPGPAHYGAPEDPYVRVYVREGASMITVSPWSELHTNGLRNAERARVQWLREQGFVGGVRTFVNPRAAASGEAMGDVSAEPGQLRPGIDFHPRATIRVPANIRRERPRFQVIRPVEAQPVAEATPVQGEPISGI